MFLINNLQAKLIRYISKIYFLNDLHRGTTFPSLFDWLHYVNISPSEIQKLMEHLHTLPELAAMNDKQVNFDFISLEVKNLKLKVKLNLKVKFP